MMRSLSTSALGQPSDTKPTRGARFGLAARRDLGLCSSAARVGFCMGALVAPAQLPCKSPYGQRRVSQRCSSLGRNFLMDYIAIHGSSLTDAEGTMPRNAEILAAVAAAAPRTTGEARAQAREADAAA